MNGSPVVGLELDSKHYSNADLLKLWLYGGRFHSDIKKAELWNPMNPMMQAEAEMSVQTIVPKLLSCFVIAGSVIRWWLNALDED